MIGLIIWLSWLGLNSLAITTAMVYFGSEKVYDYRTPFKFKWANIVYNIVCVAVLVFVVLHIGIAVVITGIVKGLQNSASKNELPEA